MSRIPASSVLLLLFVFAPLVHSASTTLPNKTKEKLAKTEELYAKHMFAPFRTALSDLNKLIPPDSLSPELGVLRRLEGHACLFGMEKDSSVDPHCAWKKYALSARAGDPEGLFYAGVILDNFLFDSLAPLQDMFAAQISALVRASTQRSHVQIVKAIATSCFYMSAVGGFAPAMMLLGNRADPANVVKCTTASTYYANAAHVLIPQFNQSYQNAQIKLNSIVTAVDPFESSDNLADHLAGLRMYEQVAYGLDEKTEQAKMLGQISEHYLLKQEYDLACAAAKKAMSIDPNNTNANYVYGVINMIGKGVQQNYTSARTHLEISARQKHAEALNALGFIHLNGFGVPVNEIVAHDFFKRKSHSVNIM